MREGNNFFGMHCFTRSSKDSEEYDKNLEYKDNRETRVFDFYRHQLSFRLPEAIKDLGSRKCFHTNKGNFFTIELMASNGCTSSINPIRAYSSSE